LTVRVVGSPFKGLAPFDDSDLDALLFFGRARETETIAANLQASRLTVLHGPSGVGKSSILRAGVAHRLRREPDADVHILDVWAGDSAAAFRTAITDGERDVYMILDQFEEYFLYHGDDEEFAAEVAGVLARPRVNVLIGIRDDSLARLDTFRRRLPGLFGNRLRLEFLDRKSAEEAIRGPIAAYNRGVPSEDAVEIEDELVSAVLDEVAVGRVQLGGSGRGAALDQGAAADRIEAPFLQLVLERLWEAERARASSHLRVKTLQELGGSSEIVRDHLERAMDELAPAEQEAAAAMYHHLVTPSGTKIAHGAGDLAGYASIDEARAADVLDRLVDERILRATSVNGQATKRYEIFHDVLADPVLAWRARHEEHRRLRRAQEQHRRARLVAIAALIGLVVVAAIAVFALVERQRARSQARSAHAEELAAQAEAELGIDPMQSLALALEASRFGDTPAVESSLRDALLSAPVHVARAPSLVAAIAPTGRSIVGDALGHVSTDSGLQLRLPASVTSVALGPNGTGGVGLQNGGVLLLGREQRMLHQTGPVTALAIGQSEVAAGAPNGVVSVWRLPGATLRTFRVRGRVLRLAYSPDGGLLLVTSHDRRARMVDGRTGRLVETLTQRGFINAAAFSPNGRLVATGSEDSTARIWDVHTGRQLHALLGAHSAVTAIAFSPNGRLVATGSYDGVGRVYPVATGGLPVYLNGHTKAITDIAFSPDGKSIATASDDSTTRTWTATIGQELQVLHAASPVFRVFFEKGDRLVTLGTDSTLRTWKTGAALGLVPIFRQRTPFVASIERPHEVDVVDRTGVVRVLDPQARHVIGTRHEAPPSSARPAAAGTGGLSAQPDNGGIAVFRKGKLLYRLRDRATARPLIGSAIRALEFSPDGGLIADVDGGYLRVWNAVTGNKLYAVIAAQGAVTDLSFSPNGRWIATAGPIAVHVWHATTPQVFLLLSGPTKQVATVLFTADGRTILSAGRDGTIRTYDCVACRSLPELIRAAKARLAGASG
jgi:WD40 repeat protein